MSTIETMTTAQLVELLNQEKATNARLVEKNQEIMKLKDKPPSDQTSLGEKTGLSVKVSDKGAISVYGLHVKFPITLYSSQWLRLISVLTALQTFIQANETHPLVVTASAKKAERDAATKAARAAKLAAKTPVTV